MPPTAPDPTARRRARRLASGLVGAGLWAAVVPYVAAALGLDLDVPASTEVVDHVVPGVALIMAGVALAAVGGPEGGMAWPALAGAAFLLGFWITATHVPLLLEAPAGRSPWDASLVHLSAGPPAALLAAWMLAQRGS